MTAARHTWTDDQDALLRRHYLTHKTRDIAIMLGVNRNAVTDRARKLGLTKPDRYWTQAERDAVIALYPTHSAEEIAQRIGKPKAGVYDMARKLGLSKSAEWMAERARQNMRDPNHGGRKTQFTSAQTPWNAGMKGLNFSPGTQFKSGHVPHTWRPIGTTRRTKDGYLERKISNTGNTRQDHVPIHHLVWRMHGRALPRGHALVFRDGNINNFDINNLELITRAELLRRNSVHRYPAPIVEAMRAKAVLIRKINRIVKQQSQEQSA